MKETFLFCSIEGFRFPTFIKHNKLKFSSALEFLRRFDADCLDSGPLFILFRVILPLVIEITFLLLFRLFHFVDLYVRVFNNI